MVKGGDRAGIVVNRDYDSCVLASPTQFQQQHKDTQYYLSDWVCKKPERIRCESYDVGRKNDPTHQKVGPPYQFICVHCQDKRGIPYEEDVGRVLTKLDVSFFEVFPDLRSISTLCSYFLVFRREYDDSTDSV